MYITDSIEGFPDKPELYLKPDKFGRSYSKGLFKKQIRNGWPEDLREGKTEPKPIVINEGPLSLQLYSGLIKKIPEKLIE